MLHASHGCQNESKKVISPADVLVDVSARATDVNRYVRRMMDMNEQSKVPYLDVYMKITQMQQVLDIQRQQLKRLIGNCNASIEQMEMIAESEAEIAVLEMKLVHFKRFCHQYISNAVAIAASVNDVSSTVKDQIAKAFDIAFSFEDI